MLALDWTTNYKRLTRKLMKKRLEDSVDGKITPQDTILSSRIALETVLSQNPDISLQHKRCINTHHLWARYEFVAKYRANYVNYMSDEANVRRYAKAYAATRTISAEKSAIFQKYFKRTLRENLFYANTSVFEKYDSLDIDEKVAKTFTDQFKDMLPEYMYNTIKNYGHSIGRMCMNAIYDITSYKPAELNRSLLDRLKNFGAISGRKLVYNAYNKKFRMKELAGVTQLDIHNAYLYWLQQPLPAEMVYQFNLNGKVLKDSLDKYPSDEFCYVIDAPSAEYAFVMDFERLDMVKLLENRARMRKATVSVYALKKLPKIDKLVEWLLSIKKESKDAFKRIYVSIIGAMSKDSHFAIVARWIWKQQHALMQTAYNDIIDNGGTFYKGHTDSIAFSGVSISDLSLSIGDEVGQFGIEHENEEMVYYNSGIYHYKGYDLKHQGYKLSDELRPAYYSDSDNNQEILKREVLNPKDWGIIMNEGLANIATDSQGRKYVDNIIYFRKENKNEAKRKNQEALD